MKPSLQRTTRPTRERDRAVVDSHLRALFERLPMICGFAIAENLDVTDVGIHSWPGTIASDELYLEIANSIIELVEERPAAIELLRGRSFARSLH
jgi:hypothetical protein